MLLHYEPPLPPNGPATIVQDAIYLGRNRTLEGGARLIARYSGLQVDLPEQGLAPARRPPTLQLGQKDRKNHLNPAPRSSGSPGRSPARFLSPQKGLETLFQEVSGSLQKRTEGWNVPKAVRAAASEVRRNVNHFHSGTISPRNSLGGITAPPVQRIAGEETVDDLRRRLSALEKRNKALASMLSEALEELRSQKESPDPNQTTVAESSVNIALTRMQLVQVYLDDPEIPMPGPDRLREEDSHEAQPSMASANETNSVLVRQESSASGVATQHEDFVPDGNPTPPMISASKIGRSAKGEDLEKSLINQDARSRGRDVKQSALSPPRVRPTLAQSPLSWILGEGQHRSDFVSSSTPPPEQRRDSVPKAKPKRLLADGKDSESRDESESEDDGFTMSSLHGSKSKN